VAARADELRQRNRIREPQILKDALAGRLLAREQGYGDVYGKELESADIIAAGLVPQGRLSFDNSYPEGGGLFALQPRPEMADGIVVCRKFSYAYTSHQVLIVQMLMKLLPGCASSLGEST
jgi:hypothetical protein